jgi:predicted nucleotidyltransferase
MAKKISLKKVEKEIKKIIFQFLDPKDYQVFIFGSRAKGKAEKFSDYDIGIIGKKALPFRVMALIEEALEESDLPYKVDVVDFALVPESFKKVALSKIKKL